MIARFRLHPKAFTRQRELPFHRLVAVMINLRKGGTELELGGFFATLLGVIVSLAVPTWAAFSKARKHISEQLFVYLNGQAIEIFYAGWSTPLWQGFRLSGTAMSPKPWSRRSRPPSSAGPAATKLYPPSRCACVWGACA